MAKRIGKYCFSKTCSGFLVVIGVFILAFSFFYSYGVRKARSVFANQIAGREELAVIAGENSINTFLESLENSLVLLSRNPFVVDLSSKTQEALDLVSEDWKKTAVVGVMRVDKVGDIVYASSNVEGAMVIAETTSVMDRDYFLWAQTAERGETYVGKPIIPRVTSDHPEYILPFVTPVFKDGEFDGTLSFAISLPRLMTTYLDPLKISSNCRVYLIHKDGTILASLAGYPQLVGVNYLEYLDSKNYSGVEQAVEKLEDALMASDTGKVDTVLYSPLEDKPIRYLIAYTPVKFRNAHWILGLAEPFNNVDSNFNPLKETSVALFSMAMLFIITLSVVGIMLAKSTQDKAYLQGFEDGKRDKRS